MRGAPLTRAMARGRRRKQTLWGRSWAWLAGWARLLVRWGMIAALGLVLGAVLWVTAYRFVNPPGGLYMWQEARRLGGIDQTWVEFDAIARAMPLSVIAAEDANFCRHNGFDIEAIRAALAEGEGRGASTLTQQVVKNVFLWHGRTWVRKVLEAALTPLVELIWSKERILEVYMNVAEFDEGVFGVQAAAEHHFNRDAADLSARQAALLAAVLPAPQTRSAGRPSDFVSRRANAIADGAATIARDDRGACFGG